MKILTTSKDYLEKYHKQYKLNFRVQKFINKPLKWVNYGTLDYARFIKEHKYVNHRELMPDEVVIDIDIEDDDYTWDFDKKKHKQHEVEFLASWIQGKLEAKKLTHTMWYSGGDGVHFHLFFPEILKNTIAYERKWLRDEILRYLSYGHTIHENKKAHVCLAPKVLIQIEKENHRKGNKKKLIAYEDYGINKIPLRVKERFKAWKKENKNRKPTIFKKDGPIPSCIKFFEHENFNGINDGWHRALFIIASWYKNTIEDHELIAKLKEWNRYTLRSKLKSCQITGTVRSNKGCVGCHYRQALLEELGVKNKVCKGCPYNREIKINI